MTLQRRRITAEQADASAVTWWRRRAFVGAPRCGWLYQRINAAVAQRRAARARQLRPAGSSRGSSQNGGRAGHETTHRSTATRGVGRISSKGHSGISAVAGGCQTGDNAVWWYAVSSDVRNGELACSVRTELASSLRGVLRRNASVKAVPCACCARTLHQQNSMNEMCDIAYCHRVPGNRGGFAITLTAAPLRQHICVGRIAWRKHISSLRVGGRAQRTGCIDAAWRCV